MYLFFMAKKDTSMVIAIIGLVLNLLIPGLGSLVGGKTKVGIWQLVLYILGAVLSLTFVLAIVGGPLTVIAWIWGIVTGVQMIMEASKK